MPKCYRQLWVKDLPKVLTWWLEWDSNLRPSGRRAPNLPLSHHASQVHVDLFFQVRANFRTAITIPERSWARFRDVLSEFADREPSTPAKEPAASAGGGSGGGSTGGGGGGGSSSN